MQLSVLGKVVLKIFLATIQICQVIIIVLDINQCLCMPKAELNTKNEPKRPPLSGRLGSFLVLNSAFGIHWNWLISSAVIITWQNSRIADERFKQAFLTEEKFLWIHSMKSPILGKGVLQIFWAIVQICKVIVIELDINQWLCMPKAELNTKNEPKRPPLCGRLGSFLVFNSVH